jgi:hypothetical protein
MRVLLTHRPGGAYGYISEGWLNALNTTGHTAQRWDGKLESWAEFKPDLYVGCSGHWQQIPLDRKNTLYTVHVNAYGDYNTGVNETPQTFNMVMAAKPDAVFGYGFDHHAYLWAGWSAKGVKWIPMPNAADVTIYHKSFDDRSIKVSYVGGYWPYKGTEIDRYLLPLRRHGLQIWGWGSWPGGSLGTDLTDDQVADILGKSVIVPCISEPHTKKWGMDVPERAFKAVSSGALAIHDHVPDLPKVFESMVVSEGPEHMEALVTSFLNDRAAAQKVIDAQFDELIAKHTYYHRMARMLRDLGVSESQLLGLSIY